MSATATLVQHGHYKEQMKLMRAEVTAAWAASLLRSLVDGIDSVPSPATDGREVPPLSRYSSYFY